MYVHVCVCIGGCVHRWTCASRNTSVVYYLVISFSICISFMWNMLVCTLSNNCCAHYCIEKSTNPVCTTLASSPPCLSCSFLRKGLCPHTVSWFFSSGAGNHL